MLLNGNGKFGIYLNGKNNRSNQIIDIIELNNDSIIFTIQGEFKSLTPAEIFIKTQNGKKDVLLYINKISAYNSFLNVTILEGVLIKKADYGNLNDITIGDFIYYGEVEIGELNEFNLKITVPKNLKITDLLNSSGIYSLKLKWEDPSKSAIYFQVKYRSLSNKIWIFSPILDKLEFSITGLTPDTYEFSVCAIYSDDLKSFSKFSDPVSVKLT